MGGASGAEVPPPGAGLYSRPATKLGWSSVRARGLAGVPELQGPACRCWSPSPGPRSLACTSWQHRPRWPVCSQAGGPPRPAPEAARWDAETSLSPGRVCHVPVRSAVQGPCHADARHRAASPEGGRGSPRGRGRGNGRWVPVHLNLRPAARVLAAGCSPSAPGAFFSTAAFPLFAVDTCGLRPPAGTGCGGSLGRLWPLQGPV